MYTYYIIHAECQISSMIIALVVVFCYLWEKGMAPSKLEFDDCSGPS